MDSPNTLLLPKWVATVTPPLTIGVLNAWKVEPTIERDPSFRGFYVTLNESKQRVFNPPQWLAFCLMSVGTVTMLYSIALPKKQG